MCHSLWTGTGSDRKSQRLTRVHELEEKSSNCEYTSIITDSPNSLLWSNIVSLIVGQWRVSDGIACWTVWGNWRRGEVQVPLWWQRDPSESGEIYQHTEQFGFANLTFSHISTYYAVVKLDSFSSKDHIQYILLFFFLFLGSDIMMQLDDVVSSTVTGPRVEEAMHRSIRWLDRCIAANKNPDRQNLFAIIQGGLNAELRKKCLDGTKSGKFAYLDTSWYIVMSKS